MPVRHSSALWEGTLKEGKGTISTGSGAHQGHYSFGTRFEEGVPGTNPEELLAAAHAACFSMALNNALNNAGFSPKSINTTAKVHLEKGDAGFGISRIDLVVVGHVPGVDAAKFQELAENTKTGCIVSRALSAVPMTLDAKLVSH
jgi:osmotically inducible protein OsmC